MRAVGPALAETQMWAILLLLLCVAVCGPVPPVVRAETAMGVRAGVGPTFPQGDLGEVTNTGVTKSSTSWCVLPNAPPVLVMASWSY